jgi:hypothetical protein
MRESRTYGFVRGAPSNRRPYRDPYLHENGCLWVGTNGFGSEMMDVVSKRASSQRGARKGIGGFLACVNAPRKLGHDW